MAQQADSISKKQLVVVVGPTAVGKTDLCVKLAAHFKTVVVSADSRQFYQEMTIGTAKPTPEEQQGIPHYFVDSHTIADEYSA
ncbi:MAG TPA: isopentenyl transferase family protein, partial [Pontibacter sp.]